MKTSAASPAISDSLIAFGLKFSHWYGSSNSAASITIDLAKSEEERSVQPRAGVG